MNAYFSRGLHYVTVEEYSKAINDYKKALELNTLSPAASQLLERAISDRDLYEKRIRENSRLDEMGITIRQNRVP